MTTQIPAQVRTIWKETRAIAFTAKTRVPRPPHATHPGPAVKTQAEKEADRWVAQMMFENYNP